MQIFFFTGAPGQTAIERLRGWGGEDDCLLIRFTNLKNAKIIRPNKGMYKELQVEVLLKHQSL